MVADQDLNFFKSAKGPFSREVGHIILQQEAHGGPEFAHQIKLAQMLSSFIPTSFSEVEVNVI